MSQNLSLRKISHFRLVAMLGSLAVVSLWADIPGNFNLTSNQTFTSAANDPFTIGTQTSTFNLQSFTATFTGVDDFVVESRIVGTGAVFIDLTDPSKVVYYDSADGNAQTGLTTVRSGSLLLRTQNEGNNGVRGNLYIGGGPNQAIVTREDKHNVELIADTSTVTIASNGTLVLNRMGTGNSQVHESLETFRKLVLDGGTILNSSKNTRLTTLNILETVQLLSDSIIDLGVAMTMNIGDMASVAWNPSATLTIKNWSTAEPIYVGNVTPQQLSQIKFETPGGLISAAHIADGQIVPQTLVPEASTLLFIPLLGAVVLWPDFKRRCLKRSAGA